MIEGARILTTEYSIGKWYTIKPKDRPRCGDMVLIDEKQYEYDGITPADIVRTKKCCHCGLDHLWVCKTCIMIRNEKNLKERGFRLDTHYWCSRCCVVYIDEDAVKPYKEQRGQRRLADFLEVFDDLSF